MTNKHLVCEKIQTENWLRPKEIRGGSMTVWQYYFDWQDHKFTSNYRTRNSQIIIWLMHGLYWFSIMTWICREGFKTESSQTGRKHGGNQERRKLMQTLAYHQEPSFRGNLLGLLTLPVLSIKTMVHLDICRLSSKKKERSL